MQIILASRSPRRKELLALTKLPFMQMVSTVDEQRQPGESPAEYVQRLSRDKAQDISKKVNAPALIIAADTIVVDGQDVLEKPVDADHATAILKSLRNRIHRVYTAVTMIDTAANRALTEMADSPVQMRAYSDDEITNYIASGDPFDKAGAYGIQNPDFHPAQDFRHCFANVMGFPLCHIANMLDSLGYGPSEDIPAACQQHLAYGCPVYSDILKSKA